MCASLQPRKPSPKGALSSSGEVPSKIAAKPKNTNRSNVHKVKSTECQELFCSQNTSKIRSMNQSRESTLKVEKPGDPLWQSRSSSKQGRHSSRHSTSAAAAATAHVPCQLARLVGLPSSTAKRSDAVPANNVLVTWVDLLTGVSSTLERGRRDRIGACVCVVCFFPTHLFDICQKVSASLQRHGIVGSIFYGSFRP